MKSCERLFELRLGPGQKDAALHEWLHDAQHVGDVLQRHGADAAVAVGVDHGAGAEVGEGLLEDHPLVAAVQDVHALHPACARAAGAVQELEVGLPARVGGKEMRPGRRG